MKSVQLRRRRVRYKTIIVRSGRSRSRLPVSSVANKCDHIAWSCRCNWGWGGGWGCCSRRPVQFGEKVVAVICHFDATRCCLAPINNHLQLKIALASVGTISAICIFIHPSELRIARLSLCVYCLIQFDGSVIRSKCVHTDRRRFETVQTVESKSKYISRELKPAQVAGKTKPAVLRPCGRALKNLI